MQRPPYLLRRRRKGGGASAVLARQPLQPGFPVWTPSAQGSPAWVLINHLRAHTQLDISFPGRQHSRRGVRRAGGCPGGCGPCSISRLGCHVLQRLACAMREKGLFAWEAGLGSEVLIFWDGPTRGSRCYRKCHWQVPRGMEVPWSGRSAGDPRAPRTRRVALGRSHHHVEPQRARMGFWT